VRIFKQARRMEPSAQSKEIIMALSVKSVTEIRRYFNGVVGRAEHHTLNVSEVIYPLLGFILLHFDPSSDIEVREYNGNPVNMLWVHISGKNTHSGMITNMTTGCHPCPPFRRLRPKGR
jgi:hypothetical protein